MHLQKTATAKNQVTKTNSLAVQLRLLLVMPQLPITRMMTTNDTRMPNVAVPMQMKPFQLLGHLFSLKGNFDQHKRLLQFQYYSGYKYQHYNGAEILRNRRLQRLHSNLEIICPIILIFSPSSDLHFVLTWNFPSFFNYVRGPQSAYDDFCTIYDAFEYSVIAENKRRQNVLSEYEYDQSQSSNDSRKCNPGMILIIIYGCINQSVS